MPFMSPKNTFKFLPYRATLSLQTFEISVAFCFYRTFSSAWVFFIRSNFSFFRYVRNSFRLSFFSFSWIGVRVSLLLIYLLNSLFFLFSESTHKRGNYSFCSLPRFLGILMNLLFVPFNDCEFLYRFCSWSYRSSSFFIDSY